MRKHKILRVLTRGHAPVSKRLTIFYLFNDLVQYAARVHAPNFLEFGSTIFLPEVTRILERLSAKEKAPFIRTLSIWEERRVYSASYIHRIRLCWEGPSDSVASQSQASHMEESRQDQPLARSKRSLTGDPKLTDISEIAERLLRQIECSQHLSEALMEPLGNGSGNSVSQGTHSGDQLVSLLASLSLELNVCSTIILNS